MRANATKKRNKKLRSEEIGVDSRAGNSKKGKWLDRPSHNSKETVDPTDKHAEWRDNKK